MQDKVKPTPCKTIRRRSRMSEALPGGLPTMAEEPSGRRVFTQLCSGDASGSQDMETAASHSSDEESSQVRRLTMLTMYVTCLNCFRCFAVIPCFEPVQPS